MAPLKGNILEEIEPDRVLQVCRIEVDHIVGPPAGDVVDQIMREVTVGIDHTNAMTGVDILKNEIAKKCRFPSAGLSDAVYVLAPIGTMKTEGLGPAPHVSHAKICYVFVRIIFDTIIAVPV
jgi:hypothetical protein